MTSKRESVLLALFDVLDTLSRTVPQVTVLRGEVLPVEIPASGLVILRDGSPGEPEISMSPLRWHYEHRAEVEVLVQDSERHHQFDAICSRIGAALAADRTLGGLCDWAEPGAPEAADLPVDGAGTIKAATIPVILHYATADPLG